LKKPQTLKTICSTTCWAHFGWLDAKDKRANGIKGHLPHLAPTEQDLIGKYGPTTDRMLVAKVRITVLTNDRTKPQPA